MDGDMSAFDYPRSSIDSKSSKGSSPTRTTDLSSASTLYYRKGNHSASSSEATRKREEKMKVIQQRLKDEQERRESALREHQEKLERVNAVKEAERRERARQIRERELSRQRAVFDRRKVQEDVDRHKRESLLNKYKVYEERTSHLNKQKPTYAFGSSTPRVLGYLEHLEKDQKIYDTKLIASPLTPAEVEALKTTSRSSLDNGRPHRSHTPSSTLRVAFGSTIRDETPKRKKDSTEQPMSGVGSPQSGRSSRSLTRTAAATRVRATANPMTQSVHVVARTAANVANTANATASPPIAPRRAPKTSHATRFSSNGPNRAMTQSFTVGDGSNTSRALTRKAALPAESRLHSTGRSSSTRALSASAHKENAAPAPTTRRPVAANGNTNTDNGPHKRPTPSRTASAAARKPPTPTTSAASAAKQQQQRHQRDQQPPKQQNKADLPPPIRKPPVSSTSSGKTSPSSMTPSSPPEPHSKRARSSDTALVAADNVADEQLDDVAIVQSESSTPDTPIDESPMAAEVESSPTAAVVEESPMPAVVDEPPTVEAVETPTTEVAEAPSAEVVETPTAELIEAPSTAAIESQVIEQEAPSMDTDMIQVEETDNSQQLTTPPRTDSPPTGSQQPTEQTEEAAKAALAERRRIAREEREQQLELERQLEEQQRAEEEERIRREEEEFRRQEEEEMRVLEEMRREEQERLERAIEEERVRRELEQQEAAKEAERKRLEEEAGKLERDRLEQEKQERQLKLQKEQEERDERKARLSAIMNRTRAAGASPASAPGSSPALSLLPGAVMSESTTLTAESPTGPSPTPFKSPILSGLLGSLNASNASNNAAVSPSAAPAPALSSNTTRALQKLATMSGNPRLNTMVNKHGSNPSLADELSAALGDQQPPHPDSNGNSPPPARMAMSMSAADWISSLPSTSPDSDAMAVGVAGMRVRGGSHGDESDLERVSFDVNQNESQDSLHVADSVSKRALDELGDGDDFDVAVKSPALQNGHASSSQSSTAEDLIKI